MLDGCQFTTYFHVKTNFLLHLAAHTFFRSFTHQDFAARKFPKPPERATGRSAVDQYPPFKHNHTDYDPLQHGSRVSQPETSMSEDCRPLLQPAWLKNRVLCRKGWFKNEEPVCGTTHLLVE